MIKRNEIKIIAKVFEFQLMKITMSNITAVKRHVTKETDRTISKNVNHSFAKLTIADKKQNNEAIKFAIDKLYINFVFLSRSILILVHFIILTFFAPLIYPK